MDEPELMTDDTTAADTEADGEGGAEQAIGLEALKSEVAALKDQALRYAAEAENTRRRAEREINDARAYAIQKFARDLLGVSDNLERALQHAPRDTGDAPARNLTVGLEMTQKELLAAFERNGLKKLEPSPGDRFDPHQHQAMMEQTSSEIAPGGVVQVMQAGYELFGRIIRPAMVVVAARDSTGGRGGASAAGDGAASGGAQAPVDAAS
jgi:molecular chaperone GrpE